MAAESATSARGSSRPSTCAVSRPRHRAFAVTKVLLQQFAAMLQSLAVAHADVTFINGQGTLAPQTSSWHNELHPSKDGFNSLCDAVPHALKAAFPNNVL